MTAFYLIKRLNRLNNRDYSSRGHLILSNHPVYLPWVKLLTNYTVQIVCKIVANLHSKQGQTVHRNKGIEIQGRRQTDKIIIRKLYTPFDSLFYFMISEAIFGNILKLRLIGLKMIYL